VGPGGIEKVSAANTKNNSVISDGIAIDSVGLPSVFPLPKWVG